MGSKESASSLKSDSHPEAPLRDSLLGDTGVQTWPSSSPPRSPLHNTSPAKRNQNPLTVSKEIKQLVDGSPNKITDKSRIVALQQSFEIFRAGRAAKDIEVDDLVAWSTMQGDKVCHNASTFTLLFDSHVCILARRISRVSFLLSYQTRKRPEGPRINMRVSSSVR